ncbi:MAG: hypothetical protein ACQPRI_00435 [Solitalea-like symbiont of Tyrophagus putrescentiae]
MEKKKNLLLKKLAVMFAAAFLVVQLVSCGDDDPLKGGNNGGTDKPLPGKVDDLISATTPVVNRYYSDATLNSLDTTVKLGDKFNDLNAGLIINAGSGRSDSTTRLVIVIAQDMFGNDLSNDLGSATKTLANQKNLIAVIGKKEGAEKIAFNTALDGEKLKSDETSGDSLDVVTPTVNSYATLQDAASKLFKVTYHAAVTGPPVVAEKFTVEFGKLVYNDGTTDLYADTRARLVAIIQSLAATAKKMHANPEDIALVALDPFMSTLVVDIAGDTNVNKAGSKITTVAALSPIMKFSSEGTDAAVNISYKDAANIVKVADAKAYVKDTAEHTNPILVDTVAKGQAFNALRISGAADKTKSFFASLVKGVTTHDLSAKTSSKIKHVVFHIAGTEKSATAAAPNTAGIGGNLILEENADNTTVGLKAIVDPASNVTVTTLALTDMGTVATDANFPTKDKVTNLFTKAPFKEALKAD